MKAIIGILIGLTAAYGVISLASFFTASVYDRSSVQDLEGTSKTATSTAVIKPVECKPNTVPTSTPVLNGLCPNPIDPAQTGLAYYETGQRGDGKMTLYFPNIPNADRVLIFYKSTIETDQHLVYSCNDGVEEISGLTNEAYYDIKAVPMNNCSVGQWIITTFPTP